MGASTIARSITKTRHGAGCETLAPPKPGGFLFGKGGGWILFPDSRRLTSVTWENQKSQTHFTQRLRSASAYGRPEPEALDTLRWSGVSRPGYLKALNRRGAFGHLPFALFPGILLFRKPSNTQGKLPVFEKNDG